jgi:hypothetical protein
MVSISVTMFDHQKKTQCPQNKRARKGSELWVFIGSGLLPWMMEAYSRNGAHRQYDLLDRAMCTYISISHLTGFL